MYDNGEGVPQDYKEAVKWYRLAAEQGDAMLKTILVSCMSMAMAFFKTILWLTCGTTSLLLMVTIRLVNGEMNEQVL